VPGYAQPTRIRFAVPTKPRLSLGLLDERDAERSEGLREKALLLRVIAYGKTDVVATKPTHIKKTK
jgi:hypothetical protein